MSPTPLEERTNKFTTENSTRIQIEGMTCAHCAHGIETSLVKSGHQGVQVDFASNSVVIPSNLREAIPEITGRIEKLGYKIRDEGKRRSKWLSTERALLISSLLTIPFWIGMFQDISLLHNGYAQLLIATPTLIIAYLHFGRSAFSSLRSISPNMDVLVLLGVSTSYIYSVLGLFRGKSGHELFFETTASITTFILLGAFFERRAIEKTSSALEDLIKLQPETAELLDEETKKIIVVDTRSLEIGNVIVVNSGFRIPADGVIKWGEALIDEALITGESVPVFKKIGDKVVGGSSIASGSIHLTVTTLHSESTLGKIILLVQEAQNKRPQIQRMGDIVSAWFVPIVSIIALLTFFGSVYYGISVSTSLLRSIAVLVISCPCAMGLATPTAVMVGLGRAAKRGILIKGGDTVERLAKIKVLAIDKTGTLTTGKFKVNEFSPLNCTEQEFLSIIVGLETHSSHPYAKAIKENFSNIAPASFMSTNEIIGTGIEGVLENGDKILIGNKNTSTQIDKAHTLYATRNGEAIGWIDLEDELKVGAHELINGLKKYGISPILISGDNEINCRRTADELGIKEWFAAQTPQEKHAHVKRISETMTVAFLGDGINDAPSLAASSVGISFGTATHAAMNAAHVVILGDDLKSVLTSIKIGKMTYRTIIQNLFWAFFYNVLAIPVAAFGALTPTIAAFTMALSDILVVGNSLLLRIKPLKK